MGLTPGKKIELWGAPLTPVGSVDAMLIPANLSSVSKVTVSCVSTPDKLGDRYIIPDGRPWWKTEDNSSITYMPFKIPATDGNYLVFRLESVLHLPVNERLSKGRHTVRGDALVLKYLDGDLDPFVDVGERVFRAGVVLDILDVINANMDRLWKDHADRPCVVM